jgi:NAD(P)-dependent dehydrogenase (short-subunit alcohol dehydrogenase family)
MQLHGSGVLITGAGRGIGRAAALRFARAGARVVLSARSEPELLATASEIRRAGGVAFAFPADHTEPAQVARVVSQAESATGGLSAVVVNAGVVSRGNVDEYALDEWRRVLDTNVTAAYLFAHYAAPAMKARQRGRFLFVSSISATRPFGGFTSYAASKAALLGFARSLAEELRPYQMQAMSIAPGSVDTEMLRSAGHGLRPDMSPEEIAELLYFLASGPRQLTGSTVDIFG